ncbi:MAG TPA: O-antigen ligase family protein [Armatimonadota bacterium]|nr:O-antigen ligase family protein [Armatimonadota bacterium]
MRRGLRWKILHALEARALAIGRIVMRSRPVRWLASRTVVTWAVRVLTIGWNLVTRGVWRPLKRAFRRVRKFLGRHEVFPWLLTCAVCIGLGAAILQHMSLVRLAAGALAACAFTMISFVSPPAGLVMWLLFSPFLNVLIRFHFLAGTPVVTGDKVCLVVLLLIYLVHARRESKAEPNALLHIAMLVFLGAMCLSSFSAQGTPKRAIQVVLDSYGAPFLAYLLARRWITGRKELRWTFAVMLIVGVYFCAFAIPEHWTGRSLFTRSGRPAWIEEELGTVRVQGPAESPGEFGVVVATAMALAVALLSSSRGAGRRFVYFSVIALCGTGVGLTLRRSVYVAAFLALIAMLLSSSRIRRNVAILLAVGALVTLVSWPQLSTSKFYSERIVSVGPLYSRAVVQATAWNIFKHHPVFGIGEGNFADAVRQYLTPYKGLAVFHASQLESPHSSYLRIMVEGGSVAFVPFVLVLVFMLSTSLRAYKRARGPGLFGRDGIVIFWGISLGLLSQAASTDTFQYSHYLMDFWFFYFGALAGVHLQKGTQETEEHKGVPAKLQASSSAGIIRNEG